jgi:hypothetical protein
VEGVSPVYKEVDERKIDEVLLCESRCDSEDTSCPEHCELVEKTENIVP